MKRHYRIHLEYAEADQIYRRAISVPQPSPGLLNNYGNHLLTTGKLSGARAAFLKVLTLDPAHVDARVQLARISLQRKSGTEALQYLTHLPPGAQQNTDVLCCECRACIYCIGMKKPTHYSAQSQADVLK